MKYGIIYINKVATTAIIEYHDRWPHPEVEIAAQIMERGDLIVIYWFDTCENSDWTPIAVIEKQKAPLCKSVGWFLNQDEGCIRILTSISGVSEKDMDAGSIRIPQKTIQRIEKVRDDELETE